MTHGNTRKESRHTQAQKHKLRLTDTNKYNMQSAPYSPDARILVLLQTRLHKQPWSSSWGIISISVL